MIRGGPISLLATTALFLAGASACTETAVIRRDDGAAMLRAVVQAESSIVYTGYKRTVYGEEGEGRATRMKVSRYPTGKIMLEWSPGEGETRRWVYESRVGWRANPDLLLSNYQVTLDSEDGPAVAWRETRRLSLRGRWPGRPTLLLLVDKETSIVLREEIRDADGHLWITKVFDSIDYRSPDEPTADAVNEPLAPLKTDSGAAAIMPLRLSDAPEGFQRADGVGASRGGVREDWTDGLAAFSIVERPASMRTAAALDDDGPVAEGELRRRWCAGRASVVGVFGGVEVTVDGNLLPAGELESVVRGLVAVR